MLAERDAHATQIVAVGPQQLDPCVAPDRLRHRVGKSRLTPGRPKVSILLITYNHEKFIAQALESVLMQETDYDYEINVIEDCSTDRTQEIVMEYVRKYPQIVKPYFNAKNIGRKVTQKNFYRGFWTLAGDYFAILEGDDYWSSPQKLQKQVAFLEANPEYAICACNTVKVYEDGSKEPHRFLYSGRQDDSTIEDVINLRTFFHTTGVIYRNVFKGVPPRHYRNKWSCDIFIMISHAEFGRVHHIDEDMAVYRAHSAGMFSNMPLLDGWLFNIDGLRRYNAWLGYRYCKNFAESIARYCKHVLAEAGKGEVAPLRLAQRIKIVSVWASYKFVYWALRLAQSALELPWQIALEIKSLATGKPLLFTRKPLLFTHRTKLSELPALDSRQWDLIFGLNAKAIAAHEIVPGQPILRLTAVPTKDRNAQNRHALCQRLNGFVPGRPYRVKLWVKPDAETNVQINIRDSNNNDCGRPTYEGAVWFNLFSNSVKMCTGNVLDSGVEAGADGWRGVWADFVTSDGLIHVYLGLVKRRISSHTFKGNGEQIIFGGVEANPAPCAS